MAIRINVTNTVTFRVDGSYTSDTGAAVAFDCALTARRLQQDELNERLPALVDASGAGSERMRELLQSVVSDWRGVLGDDESPVPYSPQAFAALCNSLPGFVGLAMSAYLEAVRARAKN